MDFILKVVGLFGLTIDDPKVRAFLADYPSIKKDKPSSGSQYLIGKEYGFDLLFEGDRLPQSRFLNTLFLYADGVDKHKAFVGDLPFGFKFMQTHAELVAIKQPDTTWVLGQGRVPSDHPAPDSATWVTPEFNLFVTYSNNSIKTHLIQIQPFKPINIESEWKPAPTWQKMAAEKKMLDAIKLYREEHAVSMAEAKAAIEAYVTSLN